MDDEEFRETVRDLQSNDASLRAIIIGTWQQSPVADDRLLPYIEVMLGDRTPCVVSIPYEYGEIRWLAAHALAQERRILGMTDPVRLSDVVAPLNTDELVAVAQGAGVKVRGGMDGVLAAFARLNDLERLPTCALELGVTIPDGARYAMLCISSLRRCGTQPHHEKSQFDFPGREQKEGPEPDK